jgi:hypothetical protein
MTKEIEVLDSLPGSGKTTAIIKYMADNQDRPWIYLSPMLEQVETRIPEEAGELGVEFFVPTKEYGSKSQHALQLLTDGKNIACTHELTLYFWKEHIDLIRDKGYRIVCDEELNLIDSYRIKSEDLAFLNSKSMLFKDVENYGRLHFTDTEMSYKAKYGDIKRLCDRGCLYGAKNAEGWMVTYLSPDLILNASRFILLTYNFGGSIMEAFLKLHQVENKPFNLKLYRSNTNIKQELVNLIEFVEPPSVQKFLGTQTGFSLSSSWWENNNKDLKATREGVFKLLGSLPKNNKVKTEEVFFTVPSEYLDEIKSKSISKVNMVPCNARATNAYAHKTYAIHAYNIFMLQDVKGYLNGYGYSVDQDAFALNQMIQWVFRGCIRERKPMKITILSKRMNLLFKHWLTTSK